MNNNIETQIDCPHCKYRFPVDVDLDEQMVWMAKECPECKHAFTSDETYKLESSAYTDALSGLIDYQNEHRKSLEL